MQADVERLLARLLTDEALRERFAADPAGIGRAAGLSEAEATMMAAMSMPQLRAAGRSYDHKRATARQGTRAGLAGRLAKRFGARFGRLFAS